MGIISKIFIIQSLKTTDSIKSGLELSIKLDGKITNSFINVEDRSGLFKEIDSIKSEISGSKGLYVIHFDCHGNEDGIGLFDKSDQLSFVEWEDFRKKFRDIYTTIHIRPIISFSSCYGFNVMKLIAAYEPCPYHIITGSLIKIPFKESIEGYFSFYDNLNNGVNLPNNIESVRRIYPKLNFIAFPANYLFEMAWEKYKQLQLSPERIQERKQQIISEIISIAGSITKKQEAYLDFALSPSEGEKDYQRFKEKFYS